MERKNEKMSFFLNLGPSFLRSPVSSASFQICFPILHTNTLFKIQNNPYCFAIHCPHSTIQGGAKVSLQLFIWKIIQ